MEEIFYNGVNIFNPIEGKLNEIIECFVELYGESERTRISDRLNDTTFLFLPRTNIENYNENALFDTSSEKIQKELLPLIKKYRIEDSTLFCVGFQKHIRDLKNEFAKGRISDFSMMYLKEFAKPLSFEVGGNGKFSQKQISKIIKYIDCFIEEFNNKYKKAVDDIESEYRDVLSKYQKIIPNPMDVEEKLQEQIEEIKWDHFQALMDKSFVEIPPKQAKKYFNTFCQLTNYNKDIRFVPAGLEKEINEMVKVCFSSPFKSLRNDKLLLDKIFDMSFLQFIEREKTEARNILIKGNIKLQEAISLVESLPMKYETERRDIIDALIEFCLNTYPLAVQFNYVDANDDKLKSVCVYSTYLSLSTETLIHEMVHAVDSCIEKEERDFYVIKSGLDELPHTKVLQVKQKLYEYEKLYEEENNYLDEFFTEFIAIKISEKLREKGNIICLPCKEVSDYDCGVHSFEKLFNQNQQFLLRCRGEHNMGLYRRVLGDYIASTLSYIADKFVNQFVNQEQLLEEINAVLGANYKPEDISCIADELRLKQFDGNAGAFLACVKKVNKLSFCIRKKVDKCEKNEKRKRYQHIVDIER